MIITNNVRSCFIACVALFFVYGCKAHNESCCSEAAFDWAIVGGGPGGIITIGVLLDVGVSPEKIIWIDKDGFSVGRMGQYYATVPANNKAKRLVEFINMCEAFQAVKTPAMQRLKDAHPEKEYPLKLIIDPLQDITNVFLTKVHGVRGMLTELNFCDDAWNVIVNQQQYRAHRVVLATGSHPKPMHYSCAEINLDRALNKDELAKCIAPDDTVAVIGSAHSAVLIMKFLCEIGAARIINFYKSPLYYLTAEQQAQRIKTCQLHGDPLSGMAAQWAREVLDVNPPGNLLRVKTCDMAIKAWIPLCTKIICAGGFEPNQLPPITGTACAHDSTTGIIGPHLFGIGIAFPEFVDEGNGHCSYKIGLREFMRFAQRVIPEWMHKNIINTYGAYEDLIEFNQL